MRFLKIKIVISILIFVLFLSMIILDIVALLFNIDFFDFTLLIMTEIVFFIYVVSAILITFTRVD